MLAEDDVPGQRAAPTRFDAMIEHCDFASSDFMPGRKFEVSEIDGDEFHALQWPLPAPRSGAERRAASQGELVAA